MWLKEKLEMMALRPGSKMLNVGSTTAEVLETQPHIASNVLAPLMAHGVSLVNLDLKRGTGVDVMGDITDPRLPEKLGDRYDVVLCSNLLEHVTDHAAALRNLAALAAPGGYLLVTVPHNYPRHPDPIDTMYRPSAQELAAELASISGITVLAADTLDITSGIYYFFGSRFPLWGYRKFRFWRRWFKAFRWKAACVLCRAGRP